MINREKFVFFCFFVCILAQYNSVTKESEVYLLYGKWILVNISGGIDGMIKDIDTNSERYILDLNADNSISYFYNDILVNTKSFEIEKRKSIYFSNEIDYIVYAYQESPEAINYISEDTLIIADNMYDGFTRVYRRFNK